MRDASGVRAVLVGFALAVLAACAPGGGESAGSTDGGDALPRELWVRADDLHPVPWLRDPQVAAASPAGDVLPAGRVGWVAVAAHRDAAEPLAVDAVLVTARARGSAAGHERPEGPSMVYEASTDTRTVDGVAWRRFRRTHPDRLWAPRLDAMAPRQR